jgi:HK97 gp10 family phage protein
MAETFVTVQLEGFAELAERLKNLPDDVRDKTVRAAVTSGAKTIRDEAKRRVPVRTGTLRDSIAVRADRKKPDEIRVKVRLRSKGFHGRFLEFGTVKMRARPFVRPAFDAKRDDVLETIKDALVKRLRREERKIAKGIK